MKNKTPPDEAPKVKSITLNDYANTVILFTSNDKREKIEAFCQKIIRKSIIK